MVFSCVFLIISRFNDLVIWAATSTYLWSIQRDYYKWEVYDLMTRPLYDVFSNFNRVALKNDVNQSLFAAFDQLKTCRDVRCVFLSPDHGKHGISLAKLRCNNLYKKASMLIEITNYHID